MQKRRPIFTQKTLPPMIIGLLIVIPVVCFSYALVLQKTGQLSKYQREVKAAAISNDLAKKHSDIISTAKEQVTLPTNETPTFATVTNAQELKNQDFFKNALNGDRILMYRKNKLAFLYRSTTKRIIAMAMLAEPSGVPTPIVTVSTQSASPAIVNTSPNPTIIPHGKILIQPNF